MAIETVSCLNCDAPCGKWDTGRTYGDPSDCYPGEWIDEPAVIEDELYFCSDSCAEEWHEDNDEQIEEEDGE